MRNFYFKFDRELKKYRNLVLINTSIHLNKHEKSIILSPLLYMSPAYCHKVFKQALGLPYFHKFRKIQINTPAKFWRKNFHEKRIIMSQSDPFLCRLIYVWTSSNKKSDKKNQSSWRISIKSLRLNGSKSLKRKRIFDIIKQSDLNFKFDSSCSTCFGKSPSF